MTCSGCCGDGAGRAGGRLGLAGDPGGPSGYAGRFGGLTPTVELVLAAAARRGGGATGVGIGVIIAANRTKHPLEARTLARLAGQYAGRGVIGFGLSNDERRGAARDFAAAFRIADRAGLLLTPHGGSWPGRPACGPAWTTCTPTGSATASPPPPTVSSSSAWRPAGITLEVCPTSNVALGVAARPGDVPLRTPAR